MNSDYIFDVNSKIGTRLPYGVGIDNSDYVLYLSHDDSYCNSNTFAWATPCVQDQYGRPIAGTINFCSYALATGAWKQGVLATLHEITHALAMSPTLFDDFIDENGDIIPISDVIITKTLSNGYNQSYIVTDNVKKRTQEYFECFDDIVLPGLPVEDDGGIGVAGAHWEVESRSLYVRIYVTMTLKVV